MGSRTSRSGKSNMGKGGIMPQALYEILGGLASLALPIAIVLLVLRARKIQARQKAEADQKESQAQG
jgi:hypothetical protein